MSRSDSDQFKLNRLRSDEEFSSTEIHLEKNDDSTDYEEFNNSFSTTNRNNYYNKTSLIEYTAEYDANTEFKNESEARFNLARDELKTEPAIEKRISDEQKNSFKEVDGNSFSSASNNKIQDTYDSSSYINESNEIPSIFKRGLKNIGNTCYMNSGLQCLNSIKNLINFSTEELKKGPVTEAFYTLLTELRQGPARESVNPRLFKESFALFATEFNNNFQNDSFEFVHTLLEILHKELAEENENLNQLYFKKMIGDLKDIKSHFEEIGREVLKHYNNLSIISKLFYTLPFRQIECLECHTFSLKYDQPTCAVLLPIPYESINESNEIGIQEILKEITKMHLSEKPDYYCSKCQAKMCSSNQLKFKNLPEVMIFQLNRFSHDIYGDKIKNESLIKFDLEISLENLIEDTNTKLNKYELIAVSNHYGSYYGGHYDCYAKDSENNQWYCLDDSLVRKISSKSVCSKNAYFLIFQKMTHTVSH